jgi:hypothetical protein
VYIKFKSKISFWFYTRVVPKITCHFSISPV